MPGQLPSLRRQLFSWLLVPMVVIWLCGAFMSYFVAVRYADLAHDRALFDSTLTLVSQIRYAQGTITVNQPDIALKMIAIDPYDKVFFKVSDPAQQLIAGFAELPAPPEPNAVTDKPYYHDGKVNGKSVRIASLYHRVMDGRHSQVVLVQVAETLVKRRMLASEILASVVFPQLLFVALIMAIVWFGIRRGLASLARIQTGVMNRSHLDLSPLPEEDAPREIRALIHALNELLGRLALAMSAQSRFVSDAAHQLRTPLAGIKTQAELALRQTDPVLTHHALQQVQSSNDRLIHLVNQLLSLARAEPGAEIPKARVELTHLVGSVAREWVPAALKKGIDLGFDAETDRAPVLGSDLMLKELLNNLIDNAVRYTPAGGMITVRVRHSGTEAIVDVEDNGPGIPEAERELVFERFHRATSTPEDGCGLGLAIVREIAHAHGGEVYLLDTQQGAAFEVRLPILGEEPAPRNS